jgi:hypothetical protein
MSDPIATLANDLAAAWIRYRSLFGDVPHGTQKQMAALLELMPSKARLAALTAAKTKGAVEK